MQEDLGDNNLNDELEDAKEIIERGRDLLALDDPKGADLIKEGADKIAQILDQVNSGDYQITSNGIQFLAHENQAYGFDSHKTGLSEEEKKAYLSYYETFQLGDSTSAYYLKPWKSIASNGNDQVKVSIGGLGQGMTADTVHFENSITGSEVMAQKQGDAYSINVRGSFHEDVQQLTAYYNIKQDSSKQLKKVPLAALNVISYDKIEKHLVLVPVNMQANTISKQTLVKYLNETYKVANVKWSIDHALQYLNVDWLQEKDNKLTVSGLSAFSNYTKEMNKLIRALKRMDDYKKDDRYSYLFLIKSSDVDEIKAFMPKKRQWGFVFTDALNDYNEDFYKTVAHELGHGCFRLTHNFDDFANVPMGTTQNLMDYGTGNELRRYQWNDIHNLRKVKLWGQDEEGNASMNNCTTAKLFEYFTLTQSSSMALLKKRSNVYDKIYNDFEELMGKLEVNAKAEKKDYKAEVANIEGWSLRASTLSENKKGFLYERILKKLEESETDKEITFNLNEKGIYLGKAKIDDQNYNLAIYTDNQKSTIAKAQLSDYCELIDNEDVNKKIKVAEIGDYLLLAFFKDEKIEMVVQFMSDNDDELKKLLTAFKVLKGEEKFEEEKASDENIKVPCQDCMQELELIVENLIKIFPNSKYVKESPLIVKELFNTSFEAAKLNTCHRRSHVLSQISIESGDLQASVEASGYRLVSILNVFNRQGENNTKDTIFNQDFWDKKKYLNYVGSKYLQPKDNKTRLYELVDTANNEIGTHRATKFKTYLWNNNSNYSVTIPVEFEEDSLGDYKVVKLSAKKRRANGKRLLNLVYKNKNGNIYQDDGYDYRGRGAIQITGRGNYRKVCNVCNQMFNTNYDWEQYPEELETDLKAIIYSASGYILWALGKDISKLDTKDVSSVTKIVNSKREALELREKKFNMIIKEIFNEDCKIKK